MSEPIRPAATPDQIEAYRRAFQQRQRRALDDREKRRHEALQAVQDRAAAILVAYPSVQRAYLFGSIVRPGAFYPTSDIDIALEGTTAADYFAVWRDLEQALPEWIIDVREITGHSPFADLIRDTGVLVYERTNPATPD